MTTMTLQRAGVAPAAGDRGAAVAEYRARLKRRPAMLDGVPAADLERACAEFSQIPEVAGRPSRPSLLGRMLGMCRG